MSSGSRQRILFVAEDLALAGVVRLKVLAQALDRARYDVFFACGRFDPLIFAGTDFVRLPLDSLPRGAVQRRATLGRALYSERTLARYVREDLALMEAVAPALVVGDMRLSLAVSAPKLRVPYLACINAYWSPYAVRDGFPIPDHPLIELLGLRRVVPRFAHGLRFAFAQSARPVNRLRRRYGLPELGSLPDVLAYGDRTLYPDVPELAPTAALPHTHRYLGPVLWSPGVPLPAFFARFGARPLVYVTLGSSGSLRALDAVLQALAQLPVDTVLASAGRFDRRRLPANVWSTDFLPGQHASARASLVICNGGSGTAYQALAEGVPVLGIPAHLDQYLSMTAIERCGAGLLVRSAQCDASVVRRAIEQLLDRGSGYGEAARALARAFARTNPARTFAVLIADLLAKRTAAGYVHHATDSSPAA